MKMPKKSSENDGTCCMIRRQEQQQSFERLRTDSSVLFSSTESKVSTQDGDKSEAGKTSKKGDTLKKARKQKPQIPNVIYIGHLPKDCEERELIAFLKQFGRLVQVRVCRSHKTGGSKGYAFVKFQSSDVAAIVAETVNGHLLFQKRLVSHVLAPEQIHAKLFSKNTRTVFQRKAISKDSDPKSTTTTAEEVSRRLLEREEQKRDKLKSMGIDYDFPGYKAELSKVTKSTVEDDKKSRDSPKSDKKTGNKQAISKADTPKEKSKADTPKEKSKADTPKEKSKRKRSLSDDGGKQDSTKEATKTPKDLKDKSNRKGSFSGEEEPSQKKAVTPKALEEKSKSKKPEKEQASLKEASQPAPELPQSEKKAKKKKSKKEKNSRKSFP
jgi:nucleolar protein 15